MRLGLGLYPSTGAIVGQATPGFDTDAQTIITAVETADGQALETTVRNAINALVVGCKTDDSLAVGTKNWGAMQAGGWAIAGPRTLSGFFACGNGSPTNTGLVAGDYTRLGGTRGNSSNKFFTYSLPGAVTDYRTNSICVDVSETQTGAFKIMGGFNFDGSTAFNRLYVGGNMTNNQLTFRNLATDALQNESILGNIYTGFLSNVRINESSVIITTSSASNTRTLTRTGDVLTTSVSFLAENNNTGSRSDARIRFALASPVPVDGVALRARLNTYFAAIAGI